MPSARRCVVRFRKKITNSTSQVLVELLFKQVILFFSQLQFIFCNNNYFLLRNTICTPSVSQLHRIFLWRNIIAHHFDRHSRRCLIYCGPSSPRSITIMVFEKVMRPFNMPSSTYSILPPFLLYQPHE